MKSLLKIKSDALHVSLTATRRHTTALLATLSSLAPIGGAAVVLSSCEKGTEPAPTPVVKPQEPKVVEVVKVPTVNFTVAHNPDGTVNLTNTSTDATGYEWFVNGKSLGTTKDLQNVRLDQFSNPMLLAQPVVAGTTSRDPVIEGVKNVTVNGTYTIKLSAVNQGTSESKSAQTEQSIEVKEGINLIDNKKFGIGAWDVAGVTYDGYSYKDPKTGELVDIVTMVNMGGDYAKIREKKWKEIDEMGYKHQADFLRFITEEPVKDGTYAGFTQDYPQTFKDLEAYMNVRNNGIGYDLDGIVLSSYDDSKNINIIRCAV